MKMHGVKHGQHLYTQRWCCGGWDRGGDGDGDGDGI